MVDSLKGRKIEDVPYSGLIESLSKITLICHTAGEAKDDIKSKLDAAFEKHDSSRQRQPWGL